MYFLPCFKPLTGKQAVILTNVNQNFKLRNLVSLHKKTQIFCNHKTLFLYLANPHTCTLFFFALSDTETELYPLSPP